MPGRRRRDVARPRRARHAAASQDRRRFTRRCLVREFVALVVLIVVVTVCAVATYYHVPSRLASAPSMKPPAPNPASSAAPTMVAPPPQAGTSNPLDSDFRKLETTLHATMGVAVSAVGGRQTPTWLGDWEVGPAWSTVKVPLVIAAYRAKNPPQITDEMKAAITESDDAAAEKIWEGLGDPATAAQKVEQILEPTGDPTTVQSQKVRPEFTAFGQTIWSLENQARFTASAFCDSANDPIFALMGPVDPDQSWGIGRIPGTEFKDGWGPSPSGQFLVRQMGVLSGPGGKIAVAIAAEPDSGSFDDGTKDLSQVGTWLTDHLGALPAGQCNR